MSNITALHCSRVCLSVCCELLSVLLAEEYAYLLNASGSFIAHRLITVVLLSTVVSCTLQRISRLAIDRRPIMLFSCKRRDVQIFPVHSQTNGRSGQLFG